MIYFGATFDPSGQRSAGSGFGVVRQFHQLVIHPVVAGGKDPMVRGLKLDSLLRQCRHTLGKFFFRFAEEA